MKRKLFPPDLEAIGSVDPFELESVIPAMVKAMLNSPEEYSDSLHDSTLFPTKCNELSSIAMKCEPPRIRRKLNDDHGNEVHQGPRGTFADNIADEVVGRH